LREDEYLLEVSLDLDLGNLDLKKNEIEYINLYRRSARYTESRAGYTPFSLVGQTFMGGWYTDRSVASEIPLNTSGYKIKGDEVVYLDDTLFVSNAVKNPEFIVKGECVLEIKINNLNGKGYVNKIIIIQHNTISILAQTLQSSGTRLIDSDMRTPLIYRANNSFLYIHIPYIPPNSVHSIFVLKGCDFQGVWANDIQKDETYRYGMYCCDNIHFLDIVGGEATRQLDSDYTANAVHQLVRSVDDLYVIDSESYNSVEGKKEVCFNCDGEGKVDNNTCQICNGTGQIGQLLFNKAFKEPEHIRFKISSGPDTHYVNYRFPNTGSGINIRSRKYLVAQQLTKNHLPQGKI
jgi:hypothetical protein